MKCGSGFGVQDILLLAGMKGLTGELVIESGNNIGSILFSQGNIVRAFSPYSRAIGDLLVENGLITDEELLATLHEQKQAGDIPIGSMFVKTGKVGFETIERMIHEQIRQAVGDFISWRGLDVSFVDKEVIPVDAIHLPVHEFIAPDTLLAVSAFCSASHHPADDSESPATATPFA